MIKQFPRCCLLILLLFCWACSSNDNGTPITDDDPVVQTSPVLYQVDQEPYENLSDYNFFEGELNNLEPVYGVIPYEPISSLFVDYAHKKRFIWMPQGTQANYVNDYSTLDFPVGTILIKNFYYEHVQPQNTTRILETRLMLRQSNGWQFANYIWNDEQTEASLDLTGRNIPVEWIENGETKNVTYRVPSAAECYTCHKYGDASSPIGPKPQNLDKSYPYTSGVQNQLIKLIDFGYLHDNLPSTINSVVNWEDTSQPIGLRVRSYVDINCAHCHFDDGHCDYRPMRFAFYENEDLINMGVCVQPEDLFNGLNLIIAPQDPNRSMLYYRISSTQQEERMPLLGRTLVHQEAVNMIEEWINSLTEICE